MALFRVNGDGPAGGHDDPPGPDSSRGRVWLLVGLAVLLAAVLFYLARTVRVVEDLDAGVRELARELRRVRGLY